MNAAEYTDLAPLLSKAVGVTKFKADNPTPDAPAPVDDSEPIKAKVTAVYDLLLDVEGNGGHLGIVRATGVPLRFVRRIHEEMRRARAAHYGAGE